MHTTWPETICKQRSRARPLSEKIIYAPGIPHTKLHTKFEVLSANIFRDIAL